MRENFDTLVKAIPIQALDRLDYLGMYGFALYRQETAVCDFVGQCVLERIFKLRDWPGLVQELSGLQIRESAACSILGQVGDGFDQRDFGLTANDCGCLKQLLLLGRQTI